VDDDIPKRSAKRRAHPNARGAKWSAQQVELQHRRDEALKLRLAGMSYPQIARQMKLSTPMVAWRYVNDSIAAIPAENAAEAKKVELAKLDAKEIAITRRLQREELKDEEFVKLQSLALKCQERRARYLGLDAPAKLEHTFADHVNANTVRGMTDEQLRRIAAGDFSSLSSLAGSTRGDGVGPGRTGDPPQGGGAGTNGGPH